MNSISSDLKELIQDGLLKTPLPIKKGNSIIIGHIVIRYNKKTGYHIFDTKNSEKICTTSSKHAAIGVAKQVSQGRSINDILLWDAKLEKYTNDLTFYNHTIQYSKNAIKVDISKMRVSSTEAEVQDVKDKLEKVIFGN